MLLTNCSILEKKFFFKETYIIYVNKEFIKY